MPACEHTAQILKNQKIIYNEQISTIPDPFCTRGYKQINKVEDPS